MEETLTPNQSGSPTGGLPTDAEIVENVVADTVMATARNTAGTLAFTDDARRILLEEVSEDDVEIRPDGHLYLPAVFFRQRLVQAFGPGGWALVRTGEIQIKDKFVLYPGALFIHGRYVAEAIGEAEWEPGKAGRMTYSSAVEAAKSNCVMRCSKDLGIASVLWNPRWVEAWKAKHAEEYQENGKRKWRRRKRADKPGQHAAREADTPTSDSVIAQSDTVPPSPKSQQWPARPWDAETLVMALRHKLTTLSEETQRTPAPPELVRQVVSRLLEVHDRDQAKAAGLIWWAYGRKASSELMLGEAETILSWAGAPGAGSRSKEAADLEAIVKIEARTLAEYLTKNGIRRPQ